MKSIALFDIDGTLLPGISSERIFARFLIERGVLGLADGFHAAKHWLATWSRDWIEATRGNKRYLKGKSCRRIEELASLCFVREIVPRLSVSGVRTLEEHRSAGREIVLLSGTLDVLMRHFKDHLGADHAHAAALEISGDLYTGRTAGPHPFGPGKVDIVRAHYVNETYDLAASFAYADHVSDLDILALFGHPVLANPDDRMAGEARKRGIETIRF